MGYGVGPGVGLTRVAAVPRAGPSGNTLRRAKCAKLRSIQIRRQISLFNFFRNVNQPANHPPTNNSAYPRALKRGGRRRRTSPTTTTITGNTSTRTQTVKSGQLTLLNPSPRHQNYTTTPHHRGLPPGAATPPIPPYPWFPQQRWSRLEWARWSRLEWARGSGSATPRPPLRRDTVGLRRAATPHLAR